tara:strand:- start:88416 stop:89894 length:1479 start_codon:yes stop_codon:yes gene_type:complete
MNEQEFDFVELFGGICGFLQGFLQAGWKFNNHYYSEIDKHAIAATKYNFKNSIHVGSVEHITGNQLSRNAIFTFGSPCQDFSIAGKRAGMEGKRSSLIGQAIRLIDETRPPVFVWENVKGAYSSNEGRDFQAILREFTNLGGYRLEWQLLNTSWVLPQNRERIYLVGHLAGRSFPGVFPFTENDRLFNQQDQPNGRRPQAQYSATTLKNGYGGKADDTYIEVPQKAGTLTGGGNSGGLHSDITTIKVLQKTGGYGVTENSNKTGCLQSGGANVMDKVPNIVVETGTLRTHKDGEGFRKMENGTIPALNARARQDGSGQPIIKIQPVLTIDRKEKRQNGRRFKNEGDPAFTLNCQGQHGIMITETASGLTMERTETGKQLRKDYEEGKVKHGFNEHRQPAPRNDGNTNTLDTNVKSQMIVQKSTIRRLTEIECERLQGFPDNWTKYGMYLDKEGNEVKKKIPKTQRYKLCGNAVTTDIVAIVATKLKKCLITQ